MLFRAIVFINVTLIYALGTPAGNPIAGHWSGRAPDPIGKTEPVDLVITATDSEVSAVLHAGDRDIPVTKVHLLGRSLTFDATRELRGHNILYHYDGAWSADTIEFTVQNDDGSSFFRFTVHRAQ